MACLVDLLLEVVSAAWTIWVALIHAEKAAAAFLFHVLVLRLGSRVRNRLGVLVLRRQLTLDLQELLVAIHRATDDGHALILLLDLDHLRGRSSLRRPLQLVAVCVAWTRAGPAFLAARVVI